jgi:histidine triad (HIT) family protein
MNNSSIITPEPKPCAFCAYINNKRPFTFVFKNEVIAILVTREQRGNPHLLIIPLRHVETILGITDQEASKLMIGVRTAAIAIEKEYKPLGISVWQNNGVPASQSIGHVHFHVAGTLEEGGTEWDDVPELSLEETEKIAVRLRPYFQEQ